MSNDRWIPAAHALELISSRFAATKKLDAASAREEAKAAIIGDLASGRLHSCPKGCLTSAFEAGEGRPGDFSFYELDANGNGSPISMEVQHEGEYVLVPSDFWANFRDPTAGASANWHDGHFSFRLTMPTQTTLVGEVRALHFDRETVELISVVPPTAVAAERTGDPGRPEKGAALYLRELERRIQNGALEASLAAQARELKAWFGAEYPYRQAPGLGTIENRIRPIYRKAMNPTK